jgi:hypothetical protein
MNQRLLKRPRGRPPKDPTKVRLYRKRTVRFRKDGKPRKERGVASASQVEAWIEKEGNRFWTGTGRPPAGSQSLVQAVMAAFGISRRTVTRIIARINSRRDAIRGQVAQVRSPTEVALAAALAERYQSRPVINAPSVRDKSGSSLIRGPEVITRQTVVTGMPGNGRQILHEKSLQETLDHHLRQWIQESRDPGALRDLNDQVTRRLSALLRGTPPGRGLEAIGLAVAPASTAPRRHPIDHLLKEALQEALHAYLASPIATSEIKSLGEALIRRLSGS